MLVLTRKLQEQIRIGNDVVITILQIRGQSVRVGIEAPRDLRVLRAELPVAEPEPSKSTVTTVELKPGEAPRVRTNEVNRPELKTSRVKSQPLANRLPARRPANSRANPATQIPDSLGGTTLALALA